VLDFAAPSNNVPVASGNNGTPTPANPSSISNLKITSVAVTDDGQDALGQWQYKGTLRLETGGIEATVTNIQVQALLGSNILATASIVPTVSVAANSSRDAVFVFASDTHAQVSALTVNVTVQFRDTNGNSGAVSSSDSCFGCWDY
jgi:hypothetical protein